MGAEVDGLEEGAVQEEVGAVQKEGGVVQKEVRGSPEGGGAVRRREEES